MATGLKITQRGTDLERAADYQTVLDSRWPLIEFIDVIVDKVVTTGSNMLVYTHNLGFAPGWEFMPEGSLGVADLAYTDKTAFYTNETGADQHVKGRLRLYLTNFAVSYKADTITISPENDSHEQQTGLKILDETSSGATMRTPEYDAYTLNTGAKAMSIHMSGNQVVDTTTNFADLTHGLGYLPTFMAWQTDSTVSRVSLVFASTFANTVTLSFRGVQALLTGNIAYIILKDPLVAAY